MSDYSNFFYGTQKHLTTQEIAAESKIIADNLQNGGSRKKKKPRGFAAMSKKDLLKKAQEKDIKGRSTMNKDQLCKALRK